MRLRSKISLAQLPLALALALVALVATSSLRSLGAGSSEVLKDNFRSVLTMQQLKESAERMDSGALFVLAGAREKGLAQVEENRATVDEAIRVQKGNVTEPGERELTGQLGSDWKRYDDLLHRLAASDEGDAAPLYFREVEPAFLGLKASADRILALNQDAMLRRSDEARREASRTTTLVITAALLAATAGIIASSFLTARLLRPLSVLQLAARRIGGGDLAARARIRGSDEIAALAGEFNAMAERIERYRKSSLGDLLQAQQTSQAAIESLPDPVVIFGPEGGVLAVNQHAEALGIRLETETDPLAAAEPAMREALDRVRRHVLGGKGVWQPRGFEEAIRVEGTEGGRWLLPRAAPVYGEGGGIAGAAVILQDVTRLRRFDELKSDMVATVAHEFRTPLTSLRMAIHLCLEEAVGPINDKQRELLHAAREESERLQGIVDDLLDLARLQGGRAALRRVAVEPDSLIGAAIDLHRGLAAECAVRLQTDVPPLLPTVNADVERLGIVLGNLVSNAIRHSPRGAQVSVRARASSEAVRFEVEDEGPGIALEHQAEIFERFGQAPGGKAGAAGLGLAIAREIVTAHGGAIGVESAPGRGARFWFTVPLA